MILSDREIQAAIERGAIRIHPLPGQENWSSTALDLTLDATIQVWKPIGGAGATAVVDPSSPDFNVTELASLYTDTADCSEGFELKPSMFILAWTEQKIQLPHTSRIAARVEGKSSLARIGMGVHVTAPTIHAGFGFRADDPSFFGNPIQLEIWNAGPLTIKLTKGMKICQLILEEVHGTPNQGYVGRFALQGPTLGT